VTVNGAANFNNGVVVSGPPSPRIVGGAIRPAIGNAETAGIQSRPTPAVVVETARSSATSPKPARRRSCSSASQR
jgi:hypothetical protein